MADVLRRAASGDFPPIDGAVEIVAPWRSGLAAVVSFTGHALIAIDPARPLPVAVPPALASRVDGFGGAHDPRVAAAIAGPDGWIDSLDVILVAAGVGSSLAGESSLVARLDLEDHPRVVHARKVRDGVRCFSPPDADAFVTIGAGLGGLTEIGVEVSDATSGRALVAAARTLVPAGDVIVAAVAPGNARALRCFLAAGFAPVGGVQLIRPAAR